MGCLALASSMVAQALDIISLILLSYWAFGPWRGGPLLGPSLWWRLYKAITDDSDTQVPA